MTAGRRRPEGIALPMALIALMVLAALAMAFALLSGTEPIIASNQQRAAIARALAESGLERAIWALSAGSAVSGGTDPPADSATAGAPYDGASFIPVNTLGGFTLKITGVSSWEVLVEAVGWTPTNASGNAHRKITATLMRFPDMGVNPPCALCVKGDLTVQGSAVIDATADASCGQKYGAWTSGAVCLGGGSCGGTSGTVKGAVDGNTTPNEPTDYQDDQDPDTFAEFTLTQDQLDQLEAMAKANGTYYGPGSPPPGQSTWTGTVEFNSSTQVPRNGVVFVDTVSGNPPTADNPSDYASVEFRGAPFATGDFQGWFIVMGNVTGFNGNGTIQGLLYVMNDITAINGTAAVDGLVVAQNINASDDSKADTSQGGNATITFNCANAQGAGQLPTGDAGSAIAGHHLAKEP